MLNRSANRMSSHSAAAAACLLALCPPAMAASEPAEAAPLPAAPAPLPDRETIAAALDVRESSLHLLEPFVNALGGVEITLDFGANAYDLYLWPHSVRSPDYRLLICGGAGQLVEADPPAAATYRGHVEQAGASRIAATLRDGQINAMILLEGRAEPPDRVLFIQPLSDIVPEAPAAAHIIYTAADTLSHGKRCGAGLVPHGQVAGDGGGTDSGPLVADLATDADYLYYQQNGASTVSTVADVEMVINNVSLIYEAEVDVRVRSSVLIVRTTDWPYVGGNEPEDLLHEFRDHWNQQHFDIGRAAAHLSTGIEHPTNVIGMAWVGVACNHFASPGDSNDYAYNLSRFSLNMNHRTALHAHELGHNFSARHCNQSPHTCSPCAIMCSSIGGCSTALTLGCNAAGIASFAAGRNCLAPPIQRPGPPRETQVIDLRLEGWNLSLHTERAGRLVNNVGQVLLHGSSGTGSVRTFVWHDATHTPLAGRSGYSRPTGRAITDDGRIVGSLSLSSFSRPAVWASATLMPGVYYADGQDPALEDPAVAHFTAISNNGHIVGSRSSVAGRAIRAISGARHVEMDNLLGSNHRVFGVNASGIAVGYEGTAFQNTAVRWNLAGEIEELRPSSDMAVAINDAGQILLRSGRFWQNGQLGPGFERLPSSNNRAAYAMNSHGTVVGSVGWAGLVPVMWQDGLIVADLNDLLPHESPWTINRPIAINDHGWIAARAALDGASGSHPVLIIPGCYANCNNTTTEPVLNITDFLCFIDEFAHAQSLPVQEQITHYANCTRSTEPPILSIADFLCFIDEFAQGCP